MTSTSDYTPPKVWEWNKNSGGKWANINRPIAGPTHDKELPEGKHPLQLYSLATPNGVKVTVMLEELLALGKSGAEYDAYLIKIGEGEQFGSGFVELNPNSKIPVLLDKTVSPPQRVFESCAILIYLAEKFEALMPADSSQRTACLSWLFWQESSASYLGGGFGHFYRYAPTPIEYCIDRYTMEAKRQLDVLDRHLQNNDYMCGDNYSIADIAIWSWYGRVVLGEVYEATEFLDTDSYQHVNRWAQTIAQRPAVKRGKIVNKSSGPLEEQLHERHDSSDFELRTQDKV
ncbi:MAG: glutathione-dependent disulfide-bond oxidoreductase [Granulosicoccus sp.]|nr:glutathione-dependent disulfide-bond oxidoreductase [Granulosicoccus sp.]